MEGRVFFNAMEEGTSASLSNEKTVEDLVSVSPEFFGVHAPLATKDHHRHGGPEAPQTPTSRDTSRVVNKMIHYFTKEEDQSNVEIRDDLYLVLPPPAGCFVGIKWRRIRLPLCASSQERLEALLSQSVELKVTPWSGSHDRVGDNGSVSMDPIQMWSKLKVRLGGMEQTNKKRSRSESPVQDSVQSALSTEVEFAKALQRCLEDAAARCQANSALATSLKAAAEAVLHTTKKDENTRISPSFCFIEVSKSRVQAPISNACWMEETDLLLRNVTSEYLAAKHPEDKETGRDLKPENGERFRTWCVEGMSDSNALRKFVSKTCTAVVPHCTIASYPQFLAQHYFDDK